MANCDALTGVGNRHLLFARGAEIWRRGKAFAPVSVVLFDLDRFKFYNDCYGHSAGDMCLKRVAACGKASLRSEEDVFVRYGGEEFLLLLPRTELYEALPLADEVRRSSPS